MLKAPNRLVEGLEEVVWLGTALSPRGTEALQSITENLRKYAFASGATFAQIDFEMISLMETLLGRGRKEIGTYADLQRAFAEEVDMLESVIAGNVEVFRLERAKLFLLALHTRAVHVISERVRSFCQAAAG